MNIEKYKYQKSRQPKAYCLTAEFARKNRSNLSFHCSPAALNFFGIENRNYTRKRCDLRARIPNSCKNTFNSIICFSTETNRSEYCKILLIPLLSAAEKFRIFYCSLIKPIFPDDNFEKKKYIRVRRNTLGC